MKETTIKNDGQILIGSNIRRVREKRNMRPKDLVIQVQLKSVDLNVFSLSKIEANTQHIKASQFRTIVEVLGVDGIELLRREDED